MPLGYLHFCHFFMLFLLNCFFPNLPLKTGCFFLLIFSLIFPAFFISGVLDFPSVFFLWPGFFAFFGATALAASCFSATGFFAASVLCFCAGAVFAAFTSAFAFVPFFSVS